MKIRFLTLALLLACQANHTPPEEAAKKFVSDLGLTIQGTPSCAGVDTDNDGYVTCTLALAGSDKPKLLSIQCAALLDENGCQAKYAQGCKETPVKAIAAAQP